MKKRLLAAAICLCMVIGLFPTIAMAEETTSIVVGSQTISGSKSNPVYAVTNPPLMVIFPPSPPVMP